MCVCVCVCYWRLVGRGQRGCYTPYIAQDGPHGNGTPMEDPFVRQSPLKMPKSQHRASREKSELKHKRLGLSKALGPVKSRLCPGVGWEGAVGVGPSSASAGSPLPLSFSL